MVVKNLNLTRNLGGPSVFLPKRTNADADGTVTNKKAKIVCGYETSRTPNDPTRPALQVSTSVSRWKWTGPRSTLGQNIFDRTAKRFIVREEHGDETSKTAKLTRIKIVYGPLLDTVRY